MRNFQFSKAIIPNSFTALNIFCGFLSIVFASRAQYDFAVYAIIAAAFFDLFDGMLARMVKTSSSFGVELDSLSDVVSFGAAPSFLILQVELFKYDYFGIILSSFPLVFGAFRLARFNSQIGDLNVKADFKGLPIPVAALTIATYVYNYGKTGDMVPHNAYVLIGVVLLVSYLMVSEVKYNAFPKIFSYSLPVKILLLFVIAAGIIALYLTNGDLLFFFFISLVLFGIFRGIYFRLFDSKNEDVKVSEEIN